MEKQDCEVSESLKEDDQKVTFGFTRGTPTAIFCPGILGSVSSVLCHPNCFDLKIKNKVLDDVMSVPVIKGISLKDNFANATVNLYLPVACKCEPKCIACKCNKNSSKRKTRKNS